MANEKRLIDANGKHTINAVDMTGFILCFSNGIISVVDRFGHVACEFYADDIPTVDAVEVVHGWWIYEPIEFTYEKDIKCSVCGSYVDRATNFCPNCGADMR